MDAFTIGRVAERTGFPTSTLRYYEDLGLIAPAARTDAGYRLYDDDAVERLAFIARAKHLGCTLEEITDLLALWDRAECGPVQRRFHELVTDKLRATQTQIAELIAFTGQLHAAAQRLGSAPVDGACSPDCACLQNGAEAAPSSFSPVSSKPNDPPIDCTLEPSLMSDRFSEWQSVLGAAHARTRTPDGRLRIEFHSDVAVAELADLVAAEQRCCSFISFALTFDTRGIALEVDAPEPASELFDAMFGAAQ
jgi:DNA-binding transcriptional MerR regulator